MLVGAAFTARRTDIGKAAERRETREIHGTGGRANTADLLESGTKSGADAFSGPPFRVRFFGQLYQESGPRTWDALGPDPTPAPGLFHSRLVGVTREFRPVVAAGPPANPDRARAIACRTASRSRWPEFDDPLVRHPCSALTIPRLTQTRRPRRGSRHGHCGLRSSGHTSGCSISARL